MEETISLQDIFKTIQKRMKLIISITVLAIAIAAIVSFFFLTPIYEAKTQLLVNQQKTEQQTNLQTSEVQLNLQLINTYNEIIKSPAILSIVIDQLDLDLSPAALSSKIAVSNANNSQVVNIAVQDENAAISVEIANTIAEVFQKEVPVLMSVDNVNVLSPAVLAENPAPVKPNKMLNIAIAAVIGLMLGVGLAFLLEYLDTTVKTEQDVEELLDLPIIGLVSPISDQDLGTSVGSVQKRRVREGVTDV